MSQSEEEQPCPVDECESSNRSSSNRDNKLEAEAELNRPGQAAAIEKQGISSLCDPILGVDTYTGLPRLPIEPIFDSEDEVEPETPSLTLTSWNFNPQSGSLTAVMSNILSSPKANRKSVTFDTQVKVKRDSSDELNFKVSMIVWNLLVNAPLLLFMFANFSCSCYFRKMQILSIIFS